MRASKPASRTVEQNPAWDASDRKAKRNTFYAYILQFDDGEAEYYAGHTNDLHARLAEHALANCETTKGRPHRLVWWREFDKREDAAKMEDRIKRSIERSPASIESRLRSFRQLAALVNPHKTLPELEEEERARKHRLASLFHHVKVNLSFVHQQEIRKAACGWSGSSRSASVYEVNGTESWDTLRQIQDTYQKVLEATDKDTAKRAVGGREPCLDCLALQPSQA